jgi:hypothetical protein
MGRALRAFSIGTALGYLKICVARMALWQGWMTEKSHAIMPLYFTRRREASDPGRPSQISHTMDRNLPFRVPLNSILLQRIEYFFADLFFLGFVEIGDV